MSKWISVKAVLPENSYIDCCIISYNQELATYRKAVGFYSHKKWYILGLGNEFLQCSEVGIEVTHWLPIPKFEE